MSGCRGPPDAAGQAACGHASRTGKTIFSPLFEAEPKPGYCVDRLSWARGLHSWSSESSFGARSEEHTSELQSQSNLVCRLLLEKKKKYSLNVVFLLLRISTL